MTNNLSRYQPSDLQSHLDHLIFEDWATVPMIRIIKVLSGRTKSLYNTRSIAVIIGKSIGTVSVSINKLIDEGYLININGKIQLDSLGGLHKQQLSGVQNTKTVQKTEQSVQKTEQVVQNSEQNSKDTIYTNISNKIEVSKYIAPSLSPFFDSDFFKSQDREILLTAPELGEPRVQVGLYVFLLPKKLDSYIETLGLNMTIKCIEKLENWIAVKEPMPGQKPTKEFKDRKAKGWNAAQCFASWVITAVRKDMGQVDPTIETFAEKVDKVDYNKTKGFLD